MKKKKIVGAVAGLLLAVSQAQAEPKFSGYVFGDYYAIASHHEKSIEDQNGFWLRRVYFTMDHDIDENFSTRLRWETSSPGDFKSSTSLTPTLKDAYLKHKHANSNHVCLLGLSPTPTWENVEAYWGYRAVEKTPLDLQKGFGDSRDLGLSTLGSFGPEKMFGYHFMLGNGSGTKSETDKSKKLYLALNAKPTKSLFLEIYGDWENKKGEEGSSVYTLQAFAHIEGEPGKLGVMVARQTRGEAGPTKNDLNLNIISVFGSKKFSDKLAAYARVDHMLDPNPAGTGISYLPMTDTNKTTLAILGIDFKLGEKVNFLPNIEAVFYSKENNVTPTTDVIPRLTFFYRF